MGRRKIEIRAIKDDRNRSVTFLKRKGGLFKKAHELSVLCSVDVAVIIFGHNKKLYEFSSGDINETLRRYQYYGPPHEHKGPNDFRNKGGDDDDEEEEEDEPSMHNDEQSLPPPHPLMAQHLQHHNSFQHIRGPGSSTSPPMPNGMFQPRTGTPGPPSIGSRPSSRNTVRRPSSNLVPMQHPHATPPQPQNGFAYAPNPPIYAPQPSVVVAPPHPSPRPPGFQQYPSQSHTTQSQHSQFAAQSHTPQSQHSQFAAQSHTPQSQHSQFTAQSRTPQPQHQQLPTSHQQYIPDQHNTSQPPPQRNEPLQPPPLPIPRSSPQPPQHEFRQSEQSTPPQIKKLSSNSRSIFTPIDEGGSILAQHFFGAPEPLRGDAAKDSPPDAKAQNRNADIQMNRPAKSSPFKPPVRTDTGGSKSGARPKLNLTIPAEASDNEESGSPHPMSALNSANPAREHHGLKLPPPSPSASAVLSAGASGPPNPFARPPPPTSNQNGNAFPDGRNNNNNLETPISALPSRYIDRELLASPGGIFGSNWDNLNNNTLPSPNIATPAEARIPGGAWGKTDADSEKRKADELVTGDGKRLKT